MKTLKINNSSKEIIVDDEDYVRVIKYRWGAYGSRTERICTIEKYNDKQISLANFVMGTRGIVYDHKDRNPWNNQKENLRVTTSQLNQANRTKDLFLNDTTSNFKGVSWHKATKKWRDYITVKDKHISLGYFHKEINAAKAYNKAALKYFGDHAYLNMVTYD